jgi:quercetin dioxygenase-like cupin family protein
VRLHAALLAVAACSTPAPESVRPPTPGSAGPSGSASGSAAPASQEEQLAAIQKAMNELDEATQSCWAAAAVERFDIEGSITALIEIGDGSASVSLVQDTTRTPKLATCVTAVLTRYRWAPPLRGQSIQLPFKFRAPDGQNVIDRTLVPWNGQAKVSMAVLLDEHNSGNGAASMLEVAIANGGTTTLRSPDRAELWYFLGPATVAGMGAGKPVTVAAGDMVYMRKSGAREIKATSGDVHAVLVMVPGGPEGSARAGALPTPPVGPVRSALVGPTVLPAATAKSYCIGGSPQEPCLKSRATVAIFAEPATIGDKGLAASILDMQAGASVPEHVHGKETELLYILEGSGTMTVNGVAQAVTPTSVIQVPPNTKHAFIATTAVRSLQIYTPAGPEQRFKGTP